MTYKAILHGVLLAATIFLTAPPALSAEGSAQPPTPPERELEQLISNLEDEQRRAQLIQQLRLLLEAQQPEPPPIADSATAMLSALSRQVERLGGALTTVAESINRLPGIVDWLRQQYQSEQSRQLWQDVFVTLITVIGAGYVSFFLVRSVIRRAAGALYGKRAAGVLARLGWTCALFVLELLPVAAFAATAYIISGLLEMRETTRLAVLSWINAILLARVIVILGRAVFAVEAPGVRLPAVTDATAYYATVWVRRLAVIPVFGYFILQVALFLGIQPPVYQALLRLLGLLVLGLLTVFVMQNRHSVAGLIAGDPDNTGQFRRLRARSARVWHLVAIVYLVVVYGIWVTEISGAFAFLARATGLSLLALAVGYLLSRLLRELFDRGLGVGAELQAKYPELRARADRYLPILETAASGIVFIVVVLAILQAWGMNVVSWLASEPGSVLTSTVATIIGIIGVSVVIWEGVSFSIERYLSERDESGVVILPSARARTLLTVARKALLLTLIVLASLLTLSELGVNIAPLLATAGVLGLAIGFGSQKLVQDVIGGVFMLLENLFSVGDIIRVGSTAGLVEAVSIRNVRLRDFSGVVHTIPFSSIDTVSNLTKDFSYYVFDVGVAYRENVDEVMEVLRGIGEELQRDPEFQSLIMEPLEVVGVDQFADSAVIIKARIKTLPVKQWAVGREFNRRMKHRFDELGIEIPFPHQTVYFGEDKAGNAPVAHVEVTQTAAPEAGAGTSASNK